MVTTQFRTDVKGVIASTDVPARPEHHPSRSKPPSPLIKAVVVSYDRPQSNLCTSMSYNALLTKVSYPPSLSSSPRRAPRHQTTPYIVATCPAKLHWSPRSRLSAETKKANYLAQDTSSPFVLMCITQPFSRCELAFPHNSPPLCQNRT